MADAQGQPKRIQVVVATSVMLSFISFWRAAAIVLNDLGSSAFYAGGIAEQAVGNAAPWFILGVMLFSYAVRSVYVESCAMFTRGGVYRVVKEAMGGTFAKLSVSALMFDYILTGPISGVSAGQYIIGLLAQTLTYFGHPWTPDKDTINHLAAILAILVTVYFWRRNTKGMIESSEDALKIMVITSVMVVIMIVWSVATIVARPETRRLPPTPTAAHLYFNQDAVGWIPKLAPGKFVAEPGPEQSPVVGAASSAETGSHFRISSSVGSLLALIGILIAFGHSVLAMSGEESLAQVNRELEYPKHKNLMRAGLVIFIYSLLFTSLVSFFAYAIIPDDVRYQFSDNLISGIAMHVIGPRALRLAFQFFIVIVGFLMLSGAVNTAIIGSNGVLNRLSEDGVLTDWFRKPHRRFGTTYRVINLIVGLQILTIVASRGNVYTLGEAYAFGVIWSFAFNSLSMLMLRFQIPGPREWKVPLNLYFGELELPLGLVAIAFFIFVIAGINLLTKQIATVSGIAFTVVFYAVFWFSEHLNERRRRVVAGERGLDQFRLKPQDEISAPTLNVRPGNVLCLVRDYQTLDHVRTVLERTDTQKRDLVMMTIRILRGPDTGYENLNEQELFTDYEQLLFSRVVALAEKAGKHVELLVVPSSNVFQAIGVTAAQLQSTEIVAGKSAVLTPAEQSRQLGLAWESLPRRPEGTVIFRIIDTRGGEWQFFLGAHAPRLTNSDIELIHQLWLELADQPGLRDLHHRDVVLEALSNLKSGIQGPERDRILKELRDRTRQ